MTVLEVDFQQQVIDLAHILGWEHLHVRRTVGRGRKWVTSTNVVGWPDLLMWSPRQPGRHIAAELKSADGKVSREQHAVLRRLADAGFETHIWRPADLSTIAAVLRITEVES